MDSAIKVVGWILAAAGIVAAAMFYSEVKTLRAELGQAQAAVETEQANAVELADVKAELERALAEQRTATEALAEAEIRIEELEQQTRVAAEGSEQEAHPDESAAEEEADDAEEAERQAKQEQRQENIQMAQLDIFVGMAYKTLFDELNLPPDVQSEMRELLVQSWGEQQSEAQKAMRAKDKTVREMKQLEDEALAKLRTDLSRVLNADELAAWEDYEAYKDQYLYENLLEGQLGMLAPDLTPENRATAKVVFAEELVIAFEAYEQSDETFSMDSYNDTQRIALQRGLERIAESVDEDQYAQVEGFVSQAEAVFDAMMEQ